MELNTDKNTGVKIEFSWENRLINEFEKDYFKDLNSFLKKERSHHEIYPPQNSIFKAFELTPFDDVKVVIIGQDPYHGQNQAHGLCFSVQDGIKLPPSLKNIFKELKTDLGIEPSNNGNLDHWAKQGVLLLNATLTVRKDEAGSHQKKGWEIFTNEVIQTLSNEKIGIVFLLWGKYAQEKGAIIDDKKHYVLKSAHPSPFSARNGFFGCKHFSRTNELLIDQGKSPIDWSLNK